MGGWPARVGARLYQVRLAAVMATQSGVAAGLSWFVAADLLGHVRPFFAPISSLIVLGGAAGRRLRRAVEMVIGVALGIAVGDALVAVIGVGPVQIAVVVVLAIVAAVLLGVGGVAVGQAAASAVLVVTLAPPSGGIYVTRFVDALIGGAIGIAVMALLLPFNPLTRVRRSADAALTTLADALDAVATAFEQEEAAPAEHALELMRAGEQSYSDLRDSLAMSQETATLAPLRWHVRPALSRYQDSAVHIDRATRNARVLARRAATTIRDEEPVPPGLPAGLRELARAVRALRSALANGAEPVRARHLVTGAVVTTSRAYEAGTGFSGAVVVAQLRSAAVDLMVATGLPYEDAVRAVRRAVGAAAPE